jgi:hypothetical protein
MLTFFGFSATKLSYEIEPNVEKSMTDRKNPIKKTEDPTSI